MSNFNFLWGCSNVTKFDTSVVYGKKMWYAENILPYASGQGHRPILKTKNLNSNFFYTKDRKLQMTSKGNLGQCTLISVALKVVS